MNYTDAMPEISPSIHAFVDECERECADVFKALDEIEKYNTEKVLLSIQHVHSSSDTLCHSIRTNPNMIND